LSNVTSWIIPSIAIVLLQRVIELPADNENPTPSAPSFAFALLYEMRTSGAPRPGETAIGMDNAASPESVAENATGIKPDTIFFAAIGGAMGISTCDLQASIPRFLGA
jgi:hypothetical protein